MWPSSMIGITRRPRSSRCMLEPQAKRPTIPLFRKYSSPACVGIGRNPGISHFWVVASESCVGKVSRYVCLFQPSINSLNFPLYPHLPLKQLNTPLEMLTSNFGPPHLGQGNESSLPPLCGVGLPNFNVSARRIFIPPTLDSPSARLPRGWIVSWLFHADRQRNAIPILSSFTCLLKCLKASH